MKNLLIVIAILMLGCGTDTEVVDEPPRVAEEPTPVTEELLPETACARPRSPCGRPLLEIHHTL